MTQMGLEYMKHQETARHNQSDEGIRRQSNVISQQEADTKRYTASFKPQEVQVAQTQAAASAKQADVAEGRLNLDSAYRERETLAKELTSQSSANQAKTAAGKLALDTAYREREMSAEEQKADASTKQAEVAKIRSDIENFRVALNKLDPSAAAYLASKMVGANDFNAGTNSVNAFLDRIIGLLKIG